MTPPGCTGCSGVCVEPLAAFGDSWDAFCTTACTTTTNCPATEKCAELFGHFPQRVCVSATKPALGGTFDASWHCDFPGSSCKDASTLATHFSQPQNQTCGYELTSCTSGCTASDAGGAAPAAYCQ